MISTPIELNEVELVDQFNTTNIQSGKQYLSLILNSKVPNHLNWIVKMGTLERILLQVIAEKSLSLNGETS